MNLLEYEAKQLLQTYGIPVPSSILIKDANTSTPVPTVLKSQVPVGGRGKLGGILIAKTKEEVTRQTNALLQLPIKDHIPTIILAEELLSIKSEFYLSLTVDRDASSVRLLAHKSGGIEIESEDQSSFFSRVNITDFEQVGDELADYYDLPDKAFVIGELLQNLYRCLTNNDATLIEINPLILTTEGKLVAGDAKMSLDDAAAFRHRDWKLYEQQPSNTNFVILNPDGIVATIANGAGLAMATVDAVKESELEAANFLDIGGGANEASVLRAFNAISRQQSVKAIVINIFAGITRCDEVARAIITAREQLEHLPPLFIRLTGTNADEANALLDKHSIARFTSLKDCIDAVHREVAL